jgi:two-component system cell cycle response regulator
MTDTVEDDVEGRRRSEQQSERVRILAVDDDRSYCNYLQLVLSRAGFDVSVAHNGPEAIERIRREQDVDLLLVDLSMPQMDGIETVRRIHEGQYVPGLYTILLTAQDGTETKLRALDSGLDDFLTKASPESEIVAKLRSAARRLEMERRLHLENEELQNLALTDELTGVANRRALFREGEQILAAGRALSVILFDLDFFKNINDTHGHLAGDRILADVAATFKEHTRYGDVIARYGGDEFVMLLPDTEIDEARQIADRLMQRIRQLRWTMHDAVVTIGASWGVAMAMSATERMTTLLSRCDTQLYRIKRVTHAGYTPLPPLE